MYAPDNHEPPLHPMDELAMRAHFIEEDPNFQAWRDEQERRMLDMSESAMKDWPRPAA